MDELRPPEFEPLAAPDGAFEHVVRRARVRRSRRMALVLGVVAVAGLAGAVLATGDQADDEVATEPQLRATTTTTTVRAAGTAVPPTSLPPGATTASTDPPGEASPSATGWPIDQDECCPGADPLEPVARHRGRVVDEAGNPLAGIYVYGSIRGLIRTDLVAVTGADGLYDIACGEYPLVLWGVGPSMIPQEPITQNWAVTYVGSVPPPYGPEGSGWGAPPCTLETEPSTTTAMHRGVVVTGVVRDGQGEPYVAQYSRLLLAYGRTDDGALWLPVGYTDENGRFLATGVPAGTVRLAMMSPCVSSPETVVCAVDYEFEAAPGEVVVVDWVLSDDQGASGPVTPGTPP